MSNEDSYTKMRHRLPRTPIDDLVDALLDELHHKRGWPRPNECSKPSGSQDMTTITWITTSGYLNVTFRGGVAENDMVEHGIEYETGPQGLAIYGCVDIASGLATADIIAAIDRHRWVLGLTSSSISVVDTALVRDDAAIVCEIDGSILVPLSDIKAKPAHKIDPFPSRALIR